MIEPVDKRETVTASLQKKAEQRFHLNGRSDFRGEKEKKTNFFLYWGPRKSRGQSGKRKSDLKRYFTTEVFNDFYKVMSK